MIHTDKTKPAINLSAPLIVSDPGRGVTVVRLRDDAQQVAVPATSAYVFWCWTPTLGTLTVAVGQRLAMAAGTGEQISLREIAVEVGHPGMRGGASHPIVKAARRLEYFDLASLHDNTIEVRTAWPILSDRRASKLPAPLREYHDRIAAVI